MVNVNRLPNLAPASNENHGIHGTNYHTIYILKTQHSFFLLLIRNTVQLKYVLKKNKAVKLLGNVK